MNTWASSLVVASLNFMLERYFPLTAAMPLIVQDFESQSLSIKNRSDLGTLHRGTMIGIQLQFLGAQPLPEDAGWSVPMSPPMPEHRHSGYILYHTEPPAIGSSTSHHHQWLHSPLLVWLPSMPQSWGWWAILLACLGPLHSSNSIPQRKRSIIDLHPTKTSSTGQKDSHARRTHYVICPIYGHWRCP